MRKVVAVAVLLLATLLSATPAEAFWHHRGCWGGGYGYRGFGGYGGYGFGGYRGYGFGGYRGFGYGGYGGYGWGGYRPYYRGFGYGFGYPGFGYGGFGYGGYGYRGIGYGGFGYSGVGYPYYSMGYTPAYYGVGYAPTYYTNSMYSPYYYGAGYSATNYSVGVPMSVNNPLYGTMTRAPATAVVSSSSFTAPVFAARPATAPVATRAPAPTAVTPVGAAVQQFLGIGELRPVTPLAPISVRPAGSVSPSATRMSPPTTITNPPAAGVRPVAPIVDSIVSRFSNVDSRRRAEKMITEADELFKAQNFHSALQKYKLAAATAPDMPEAFWRQGHALVATHNYELAATAFKRAIALTTDLGRGGFRLSDIYGSANMTKKQHLESLAEWATNKRNSSDPYFLIGLFLEYDGQPARAEKFFQKANDLAGIGGGHVAVFLDPVAPTLLKSVERAALKPAPAVPIVAISTGRDI